MKTRKLLEKILAESPFDGESGDEWKQGGEESEPQTAYPSDYTQRPSTHQPHEMETVYDQFTDGDLVDIVTQTVDRLGGLVPRGEVPNTEFRFHIMNGIENLEKALAMVDD